MSEIHHHGDHRDAEFIRVARTSTRYEPVAPKVWRPTAVRKSHTLLWLLVIIVVLAGVVGGLLYLDGGSGPAKALRVAEAAASQPTAK